MKTLVIYDSIFGNTEQIAQAIADMLSPGERVRLLRVNEVTSSQLTDAALLIIGSPTRAFNPTPAISRLLKGIPKNGLKGISVAAFDTRVSLDDIDSTIGRFFITKFGYAALPIAGRLKKKGGDVVVPPIGFFVESTECPLKDGETRRAADWARQIKTVLFASSPDQVTIE